MITSVEMTLGNKLADRHFVFNSPAAFLAFGFGSGLSPKMPGTMGTIVAIPLYLLYSGYSLWVDAAVIVIGIVMGVWLCSEASRQLGVHDHSGIVWDEFVGFWITMFAVPSSGLYILIGFVLFRFFDILKPWPICWFDKHVHGGVGIMVDDVLAGVAAACCMQLIVYSGLLAA